MFMVDTNIFLHAINTDSSEHEKAFKAVESYANGAERWAISWGVVYEFLRVATHTKVFPKPLTTEQAYAFIKDILRTPSLAIIAETSVHQSVFETSAKETHRLSGNLLHDLHIAVLMREHGIRDIVTLDTDFKAFPWVAIKAL